MTLKTLIPLFSFAIAAGAAAQESSQEQTAEQAMAEAAVEAAATNTILAMKLCLENYQTPVGILQAFQQAGFAHTPEDFGDGTVLHWYATPDQNVPTTDREAVEILAKMDQSIDMIVPRGGHHLRAGDEVILFVREAEVGTAMLLFPGVDE